VVEDGQAEQPHRISVVIPVYQGETTLARLVDDVLELAVPTRSPDGNLVVVSEVLLVHDHGPDRSPEVMRRLAAEHHQVRALWLSRNFGQHAATLAGMASTGGDWIATLDEDGEHDPAALPSFVDAALRDGAGVVYARPTNPPPHGLLRNAAARVAKGLVARLAGQETTRYQSYRLVLGEIGRSVAAYSGSGVYLDVAMGWVNAKTTTCPVRSKAAGERPSGYSTRRLLSHFWRLVLSSGTKGLRLVSWLGALFGVIGVVVAAALVVSRLTGDKAPEGWTSTVVALLLGTGAILFSLGVIAEYVGVAVNMAMGKPLYLLVSDPQTSPLARRSVPPEAEPASRELLDG
jgi:glycosyltransferase involved in cell wall biosynthesis